MTSKKTLEDYMNDPDIIDEPMYLREIHAIRFKIQDETKGMTFEQRRTYYHNKSKVNASVPESKSHNTHSL
jgi:hypothetical protein